MVAGNQSGITCLNFFRAYLKEKVARKTFPLIVSNRMLSKRVNSMTVWVKWSK